MGADANTKQIVCSRSAELLTPKNSEAFLDAEFLKEEDSTLPLAKAVELVNKCINLETHAEELKKFKEVGSKTPILPSEIGTDPNYKFTYVWFNLIGFIILHTIGLSGALAAVLGYCSIWTSLYCKFKLGSSKRLYDLMSNFYSFVASLCRWSRCYDGCSSSLESQIFQSIKMA